jgi:hypothetical protein
VNGGSTATTTPTPTRVPSPSPTVVRARDFTPSPSAIEVAETKPEPTDPAWLWPVIYAAIALGILLILAAIITGIVRYWNRPKPSGTPAPAEATSTSA